MHPLCEGGKPPPPQTAAKALNYPSGQALPVNTGLEQGPLGQRNLTLANWLARILSQERELRALWWRWLPELMATWGQAGLSDSVRLRVSRLEGLMLREGQGAWAEERLVSCERESRRVWVPKTE